MFRLSRGLSGPEAVWCRGILALSFAAYLWIFLPLIPADGKPLGHDYSSVLPNLLAGYYWFLNNGPLDTPWFSPAQCGGVPFFADLAVGYRTFPQWVTFAVGPVTAVRATFALFAGLGAIGCYLLLRSRFGVTRAAATAAAVLFLYSGFYTYRMAIGHVLFHPYALTPWLAWAALAPRPEVAGRLESVCLTAWPPTLGGLIFAYMVQAGMVHVIPCAGIAVAVILLVHGHIHGHRSRPWIVLAAAALAGCALSASRIAAALAFLGNFPRSDYPLPGFPDSWDLLGTAAAALFWRVSAKNAMQEMENLRFALDLHVWEYGLGPAALALLVAGAAVAVARFCKERPPLSRLARSIPAWIAITTALALPLLLNWYEPRWNSLLKSLPYFGSASNLLSWFALYVPVFTVLAGLALHRIAPVVQWNVPGVALVAAVTIAWNAAADKSFYTGQRYDGARMIERAWHDARSSGRVPAIEQIVVSRDHAGKLAMPLGRNDELALGHSQLLCYEPIFGYRLEHFPIGPLRPGPALGEAAPGVLNVKNPACYLFPRENGCVPGAHFGTGQRADAARFLRYQPFAFVRPPRQLIADSLALAALALAAATILAGLFFALRRVVLTR